MTDIQNTNNNNKNNNNLKIYKYNLWKCLECSESVNELQLQCLELHEMSSSD